jgi:hypothetical protein
MDCTSTLGYGCIIYEHAKTCLPHNNAFHNLLASIEVLVLNSV